MNNNKQIFLLLSINILFINVEYTYYVYMINKKMYNFLDYKIFMIIMICVENVFIVKFIYGLCNICHKNQLYKKSKFVRMNFLTDLKI